MTYPEGGSPRMFVFRGTRACWCRRHWLIWNISLAGRWLVTACMWISTSLLDVRIRHNIIYTPIHEMKCWELTPAHHLSTSTTNPMLTPTHNLLTSIHPMLTSTHPCQSHTHHLLTCAHHLLTPTHPLLPSTHPLLTPTQPFVNFHAPLLPSALPLLTPTHPM